MSRVALGMLLARVVAAWPDDGGSWDFLAEAIRGMEIGLVVMLGLIVLTATLIVIVVRTRSPR